MTSWLLLIYKIPNEPSARRVYVWRKLKRLGAILLHDAVWVLPATPRTHEKLQWLATEIKDMEGEASLWNAQEVFTGQNADLIRQFTEQVDTVYQEILIKLASDEVDLLALSKQYQHTHLQDYFQSELGQQVRHTLISRRGENGL